MEGELVIVSIISGIFGIFGLLILNLMWFKKEMFRVKKAQMLAENKLRMKKLERELLGTGAQNTVKESQSAGGFDLGALAPLIKNMPPEQIASIVEKFLGGNEEEGEAGGIEGLLDFARNNPEIVDGILKGIAGGSKNNSNEQLL